MQTASHRRWHKPRDQVNKKTSESSENEPSFPCKECGKAFKRQAYLKKHLATHNKKTECNSQSNNSKKLSLSQNESSASSFNVHSSHSHDSADVLIPKPVFSFNRAISPAPSSDSEHELVINENSNSSINSSAKFNLLSDRFTEDENIAISALANLRSGSSVIRHTLSV